MRRFLGVWAASQLVFIFAGAHVVVALEGMGGLGGEEHADVYDQQIRLDAPWAYWRLAPIWPGLGKNSSAPHTNHTHSQIVVDGSGMSNLS